MDRTFMVLLILLLMGGYTGGCSNDESGAESKTMGKVESLKKKASKEMQQLEEDYRVLESEKDYKKYLEEEPKPPPAVLEKGAGGVVLGEGIVSPPE